MRTTKKEREKNAREFYQMFMNGNYCQAAIVVNRIKRSTINRCQFLTVKSSLAYMENPVMIAESIMGISGCFYELLSFLKFSEQQKNYFDDDFNNWLEKNYNFKIIYKDGLVFMLGKCNRKV